MIIIIFQFYSKAKQDIQDIQDIQDTQDIQVLRYTSRSIFKVP